MNTHILIPITEELEEAIRAGLHEILSEAVFKGKQISLDKKEIGEKAVAQSLKFASTAPEDYSLGYIDGYKQLIKDLL